MEKITEKTFSKIFFEFIKKGNGTFFPGFDYVFEEVAGKQGIADFIALEVKDKIKFVQNMEYLKNNSLAELNKKFKVDTERNKKAQRKSKTNIWRKLWPLFLSMINKGKVGFPSNVVYVPSLGYLISMSGHSKLK